MTFDPGAAAAPDSGIFGLNTSLDESRVVIVPVPFEATTSYGGGTSGGPAALLAASRQVDLFDFGTGRPYESGIIMLDESKEIRRLNRKARRNALEVIERGGRLDGNDRLERRLAKVNAQCARVNEIVYDQAKALLDRGKIVGTLGGDHAAPYGSIQAHAERFPGMGILHVDAHCDLRPAYEGFEWSHASIMYNVLTRLPGVSRLVQVGIRDFSEEEASIASESGGRVAIFHDEALVAEKFDGVPWARIVDRIVGELPGEVYVSFDIDGLDPALCPHTGTPVPGGLGWHEAIALIAGVHRSGRRIVGFDLDEVTPGAEGDEWDANVGARLLYKLIGYTLLSQPST